MHYYYFFYLTFYTGLRIFLNFSKFNDYSICDSVSRTISLYESGKVSLGEDLAVRYNLTILYVKRGDRL